MPRRNIKSVSSLSAPFFHTPLKRNESIPCSAFFLVLFWKLFYENKCQKPEQKDDNQPPLVVKRNNTALIVVGIVLGLVILIPAAFVGVGIISAIAIPNLLESRKAADEAGAVANLRTVHTAQMTYSSTAGEGKFGSFEDLKKADLIDGTRFTRPDPHYSYTLTMNASKDRYCLVATPKNNQNAYGVGSGGGVYRSEAGGIACQNGVLGRLLSCLGFLFFDSQI